MELFSSFAKKKQPAEKQGFEKNKPSFWERLNKHIIARSTIDDTVLDAIEEQLITADVGLETTLKLIASLEKRISKEKYTHTQEVFTILQEEILSLLAFPTITTSVEKKPYVVLVVGVNGVGKTTTIGKLAAYYTQKGHKVILGAADTFRAAATQQIQAWGTRANVPVISKGIHADPAAVVHDTVQAAMKTHADIILIDTAGRLHNKINLMHELSKIKRIITKLLPEATQEVLLVLDASTGQNAFIQTKAFLEATDVTALAITKLDGTAKAGVIIGIADQFKVPIKYIGVGEKIDDLQLFDKEAFVNTLF